MTSVGHGFRTVHSAVEWTASFDGFPSPGSGA